MIACVDDGNVRAMLAAESADSLASESEYRRQTCIARRGLIHDLGSRSDELECRADVHRACNTPCGEFASAVSCDRDRARNRVVQCAPECESLSAAEQLCGAVGVEFSVASPPHQFAGVAAVELFPSLGKYGLSGQRVFHQLEHRARLTPL